MIQEIKSNISMYGLFQRLAKAVSALAPNEKEQTLQISLLENEKSHKESQKKRDLFDWKRKQLDGFLSISNILCPETKEKIQQRMSDLAENFLQDNLTLEAGLAFYYTTSVIIRSGPVRSGPVRSGPVRSGPVWSGPRDRSNQRVQVCYKLFFIFSYGSFLKKKYRNKSLNKRILRLIVNLCSVHFLFLRLCCTVTVRHTLKL
jgi:hypothetical protein